MPWWGYIIIGVCTVTVTGIVLPTWLHVRVKLLELETRIVAVEKGIEHQGDWLHNIAAKLEHIVTDMSVMKSDTAEIKGYLKGRGNNARVQT